MVSLKDIAKECQVSVATVSKALNDHADISEERKKMIREKAEEMGYHPNLFARTLKTNRSYNIGVLFTDAEHNGLTHDYFAAVLDSFKVAAEARDYDLTFVNCGGSGGKRMTYLEHARYRGFDGIMIACVDFSEPEVLQLALSDIPVVTIDYISMIVWQLFRIMQREWKICSLIFIRWDIEELHISTVQIPQLQQTACPLFTGQQKSLGWRSRMNM